MHYLYLDSLHRRRVDAAEIRSFCWGDQFSVKAKIIAAPSKWLLARAAEIGRPSDRADWAAGYVWVQSRRAPAYDGKIAGVEDAYRLVVPPGVTFEWAGIRGPTTSFGLWVELSG